MLKVVKAQGQGIVSDSGRWGYQHQGVPVGGVLDDFSFQVANQALGNPVDAACLELMGRFDFVCALPCTVFLANRGAVAFLNGRPVCSGQVLELHEGDVLRTQAPTLGYWNMLCMQGGVKVPPVLDSRSSCLAAGFGGYQGRALMVGDEIHAGAELGMPLSPSEWLAMPLAMNTAAEHMNIHVLPGPEYSELTEESREHFTSQPYLLGAQSSRMGYRLESTGLRLSLSRPIGLNSHSVHPGIVQLPPSGQPVVLLSEAQVTGGYPRIASILACELWRFAQLDSRQPVRWVVVDEDAARQIHQQHAIELERYSSTINTHRRTDYVD